MRSGAASPVFKWRDWRVVERNARKLGGIEALVCRMLHKKRCNPVAMASGGLFDRGSIDPAKAFGKVAQLLQRRVEQPQSAGIRAAFDVVIRGRELNQTLQKTMHVRLRFEPDRLPRHMRIPELGGVEVIEAGAKVRNEVGLVQSSALVPRRSVSHIAVVKSVVVPVPPMSRVRCSGPESSTFTIASSMRFAAPISPRCCSIRTADLSSASGFALFWPAMSGALPCTASKTAPASPMFAPATTPRPPTSPAARSDTMSP